MKIYECHRTSRKLKHEHSVPLYYQILDLEAIELHKMISTIKAAGGSVVYVNTDNVVGEFKATSNTYMTGKETKFTTLIHVKQETSNVKAAGSSVDRLMNAGNVVGEFKPTTITYMTYRNSNQ